ncbi:cilia- and flagella-associated protein 157 [Kryptolebias marmoratus]|uniref:cilia- and flagella-associated protein 157 n=1 Tax=Kryptolebias marmoratus TaxID=37003 RepID=UPI0007F8A742|nr:cilia- and flagella-associated protein 157 [Kryptolebias marmoratus]
MSPKRNKTSVDKKKKTSSESSESPESPADKRESDGREKQFYRTQLGYLTEELDRFQLKCSELQKQNRTCVSESSRLQQEKQDIIEYLKHALTEKEEQLDELSEQLESQRRVADQNRAVLLLQHAQLKAEGQKQMDELQEENRKLEQRLAVVEEFLTQKEELISNMEDLKKQLDLQQEKHKEELHGLETKALLERRRFEEELERRAAAEEATVQHLVEEKLPEASRVVLQENLQVKAFFRQLSEQKQVLMEDNAALREQTSRLSVDLEILEQTVRQTSRTNWIRKKEVQQLQTQLSQVLAETEELRSKFTPSLPSHQQKEPTGQNRASLSEQRCRTRAQTGQLEAELKEERRRSSRMKSVIQEAALALRHALMEPADLDQEDSVDQRKQLLQNLLDLLDRQTELQASDPGTEREENTDFQSSRLQQNHCRPAGTGVLSDPTLKTKSALCRTGAGPNRTLVPLHRKPVSQKPSSSAGSFIH